jgi:uncharacterized protein (TIGR03435 family)
MNLVLVSKMSDGFAAALGNHLWQSTLFGVATAMLILLLRKDQARTRYAVWLAASVKFLVPFAWLAAIGRQMAWLRSGTPEPSQSIYATMQQVGEPFTRAVLLSPRLESIAGPVSTSQLLLAFLFGVWLCGFAVVLLVWCVRWRRIATTIRGATPLDDGRELKALRRLERVMGVPPRVEMLLSRASLEPGIFGVRRPVLLWPEGISDHLDGAHLEAVIAHELWHVRRHDNFAAAVHMLVEALFWFHPLVWWLGTRLVDERERACDEEVLQSGSERHVYAESILKVCEFCVGSPLACVSGVTGSDLKKRMVHIMSEQVVSKLNFSKKVLLGAAGALALAAPIVIGLASATPSRAESPEAGANTTAPVLQSVTIKPSETAAAAAEGGKRNRMFKMMYMPDGFTASGVPLQTIVQEAYGVQASQIEGAPEWLKTEGYDVDIKMDQPETGQLRPHDPASKQILQEVLADRLQLKLHSETKTLPAYALEVAEGGSKLQAAPASNQQPGEPGGLGTFSIGMHRTKAESDAGTTMALTAQGMTLAELTEHLSHAVRAPVVDKSGLKGTYNFSLQWTRDASDAKDTNAAPADNTRPPEASLTSALQQQLGLKLVPQNEPVQVLVIDHVEKPAAD